MNVYRPITYPRKPQNVSQFYNQFSGGAGHGAHYFKQETRVKERQVPLTLFKICQGSLTDLWPQTAWFFSELFPDVESYLDFKGAYVACNNILFPRNDWQVPHSLEDKGLGTVPNSGRHGLVVSVMLLILPEVQSCNLCLQAGYIKLFLIKFVKTQHKLNMYYHLQRCFATCFGSWEPSSGKIK
jgi:hypothetical protein